MRQLVVLAALVVALAVTGAASAGGWATVGVDPYPTDVAAGDVWPAEITVLQHGQTPLAGLSPTLTIRDAETGAIRDFAAAPTSETGVYAARVVFPETGRWNVVVESGFGDSRLTFGPVTIGEGPTGGTDPGSFPVVPVGIAAFVLALLAAAVFGVRRISRPAPVSR